MRMRTRKGVPQMTQSALQKRLAALERENKMLRSMLEEAGWVEGRAVIRAAMRESMADLAREGQFTHMGTVDKRMRHLAGFCGTRRATRLRACARLAAKRKAMRAK